MRFTELERDRCRWPTEGDAVADYRFCGEPVANETTSYCPLHHAVAYRPTIRYTRRMIALEARRQSGNHWSEIERLPEAA